MKNNYHLLKSNFLLFIAIGLFSFISISVSAQAADPTERILFIQINNLNPDEYFKLKEVVKGNEQINIKQACIPAEVIMFSLPASNTMSLDENFNQVKGMVLESTNLNAVSILAEYSEQDFMDRCKMYRTGAESNQ